MRIYAVPIRLWGRFVGNSATEQPQRSLYTYALLRWLLNATRHATLACSARLPVLTSRARELKNAPMSARPINKAHSPCSRPPVAQPTTARV
jgi:hypothetical protein